MAQFPSYESYLRSRGVNPERPIFNSREDYIKFQGAMVDGKFTPYRGSDAHKLAGNVLGAEYRTWLGWGFYGSALFPASVAFCCGFPGLIGSIEALTNLQNQLAVGVGGSLALFEGAAIASTVALAVAGRKMFKERKAMRTESLQLANRLNPHYQRSVRNAIRPNVAVAYRDENPLPSMELTRRGHSAASTFTSVAHWTARGLVALSVGGAADIAATITGNPILGQVLGIGLTLTTGFFMASRFGTAGEAFAQLHRTKKTEKTGIQVQQPRRRH